MGNSGVTAADAQLKFFRLRHTHRLFRRFANDAHVGGAAAAGNVAVVVAISNSGRTALLEAIQIARDASAKIIAISRNGTAASTQQADLLLPANMPENPDVYSPMVSCAWRTR
ncbi:MAG: SIS domain-containing protein [Chitinivorax sp.]